MPIRKIPTGEKEKKWNRLTCYHLIFGIHRFLNAFHFINEEHSGKHAFLPHTHNNYLELFYVYSGTGQYMADYLGFSSISHLNTMFSKYIGIPPGKYRQSVRNMDKT